MTSIHVVLNAASGFEYKKELPEVFGRVLGNPTIWKIEKGMDPGEYARKAVLAGADIVVASGGDGTVNAVVSALVGTGVVMGVVPAGTLNHFARDLGIPLDLEKAAAIIANGRTVCVDVGEVNGRRFINNAIIGLYPAYRLQRDRGERHGRDKWLAISSAIYSVFRWNPALRVKLESEGQTLERKTPFLMVANNLHEMEGYRLGNRQSLREGMLWAYVMHRMSRTGLLRLGLGVLLGRLSKSRDFDVIGARALSIESRRKRIRVSLDGEIVPMKPPLRYRSMPRALNVIVPPSFPG